MIQAAFASLGDGQDRPIGNDDSNIYWNMYTAPAWLSVMLSLINIVVLMPFIFTEFNIAKEEGDFLAARGLEKSSTAEDEETVKKVKPDKVALIVCIVITATTQFNFNFIERCTILHKWFILFSHSKLSRLMQHGYVVGD